MSVNGNGKAAKHQTLTKQYALYCGDSCEVLPELPASSVGFSVFSPPFWSMYTYSDNPADLSNCKSYNGFMEHFSILVKQLERVMMPGRVVAVHCMDMPTYKREGEEIGLRDFSGDLIRLFQECGFVYHCPRITIWKDPLVSATRTKAIGLAHKQIVKDSALCRTGIPDYILAFRKPGENPKPIPHPDGLVEYCGSRPVPSKYDQYLMPFGNGRASVPANRNKRSHWIWQQYASPVWFDIRQTKVLPYKQGKDKDDERHICPLQTDVIERCLELWSTKDDVVLTPFMGIGSEVYVAVKNGRKGIGIELKESYYKQAVRNLKSIASRGEVTK